MSVDVQARRFPKVTVAPAAYTADVVGNGVNVGGFAGVMVTLNLGTVTDGTWTPKLQESVDNSVWTDVAAEDVIGELTVFDSADSDTVQKVGYKGQPTNSPNAPDAGQRFVRLFITETIASSTGALLSAIVDTAKPGIVGDLSTVGVTPTGNELP